MACAHAKFTGEVGVCLATSGPGRDPPAQRPLRRQARPPAGRRDRRPAGARGARRQLPAGGRPARRCSRTSPRVRRRSAMDAAQIRAPDRPRDAHRRDRAHRRPCVIVPNDVQEADAVEDPPRAHGTLHSGIGDGYRRAARRARATPTCAAPPRCSTPASRSRCWSAPGALHAAAEVIEVADLLGAGVAKALLGKAALPDDLPCVTGSIGLLGTKPSWDLMTGLRHAADGRLELPLLRVPARGGPGARRADRHRRRACSASATRWRSTSSATAPQTLRALLPLLRAQGRPRPGASRSSGEVARLVGADRGARARAGATRSTRSACSGSCRQRLPDGASSPPTRARRPTGTRATCDCARA